ncbi:hypothetical protein HOLleu_24885 [Holothuria leucospilota]|uniref:Reverse transcriptase n=1 Tax=Holothuria leucospilota TaxID=206669 RepID=A0A9Q1H3K3_HOLLE|nr:hypothetical protein HOLleu_24885 [Holothuria leucospilota]
MEPVALRKDEYSSVINLSSKELSVSHLKLLSKGLKFAPVPPQVDSLGLKESLECFSRSLRLAEYFHGSKSDAEDKNMKFRKKSSWTPPTNRDKHLDAFIDVVKKEIMEAPTGLFYRNISSDERCLIKELQNDSGIVIKEADKGSAVVVMDMESIYKKVDKNVIIDIEKEASVMLHNLYCRGVISKNMLDFAIPNDTKAARFSLLPKVHKIGVPGRPVISGCGSATEGNSELVGHFIQALISSIPSYFRDTTDFLDKLRKLGPLPKDAIIATIDVVSLYPSIPQPH